MSRGPGWIEKEIINALSETMARPVFYLSHRCHMIKHKRKKDINLYTSVCRAVRRLEHDKGILKSKKIPLNELTPGYLRYTYFEHNPTYVKMVWLDIRK